MNRIFQVLFLSLSAVSCINASEVVLDEAEKLRPKQSEEEEYKKYFAQQEEIYKGLQDLKVPGVCCLNIDMHLAESVLATCPNEILEIIAQIDQRLFFKTEKDAIFYGPSGTGKSVLAQAIAIKCKVPCLIFDTGTISTEYMNSGVQNLNKIFQVAQELVNQLDKPCMVIFEELESLTRKHTEMSNHENNILISFWRELDRVNNKQVVVIGTMNIIEDMPEQMINRTAMIKVSLPSHAQREKIASFYLTQMQQKYNLVYPEWCTADYFAELTNGYSNRNLEKVIVKTFKPVIMKLNRINREVTENDVTSAINQMEQSCKERYKHSIIKYLKNPNNILAIAQFGLSIWSAYNQQVNFRMQMAQNVLSMGMQIIIAATQMKQLQANHDEQMNHSEKCFQHEMHQAQRRGYVHIKRLCSH